MLMAVRGCQADVMQPLHAGPHQETWSPPPWRTYTVEQNITGRRLSSMLLPNKAPLPKRESQHVGASDSDCCSGSFPSVNSHCEQHTSFLAHQV